MKKKKLNLMLGAVALTDSTPVRSPAGESGQVSESPITRYVRTIEQLDDF